MTRSEEPPFTIETLTGQKAHVPLGVRAVGKSLIITEPISLPNPCYWVGAEVQRRDFEISVLDRHIEGLSRSYGDAPVGTVVAILGSSGRLEIAQVGGAASDRLGLGEGDSVILRRR